MIFPIIHHNPTFNIIQPTLFLPTYLPKGVTSSMKPATFTSYEIKQERSRKNGWNMLKLLIWQTWGNIHQLNDIMEKLKPVAHIRVVQKKWSINVLADLWWPPGIRSTTVGKGNQIQYAHILRASHWIHLDTPKIVFWWWTALKPVGSCGSGIFIVYIISFIYICIYK
jgi:hypothetical protein